MTGRQMESAQANMYPKFHSFCRSRKLLILGVAGVGLLVAGGSIAAASVGGGGNGPSPATTSHTASPIGQWTTPTNEINAPLVLTPGGASGSSGAFNAVSCPTSSLCVAVGGDANLKAVAAVSTNGGSSWSPSALPTGLPELNAVGCSSSSHCVGVGEGYVVTTNDGGNTWTAGAIPTADTTLLGVSCPNSTICVSVGVSPVEAGPYDGQALVSSDGGNTWKVPSLPAYVGALGSVDCPSTTFCVAVGASILVSNDGGATWKAGFVRGGTGILRSVSCSSTTDCVAIGPNPIGAEVADAKAFGVVTTDGGNTWSPDTLPKGSSTLNAISCASDLSCMAGGPSINGTSTAATSSDGGSTWKSQSLPIAVTAVASLSCQTSIGCLFVGLEGSKPVTGSSTNGSSWSVLAVTTVAAVQSGQPQ